MDIAEKKADSKAPETKEDNKLISSHKLNKWIFQRIEPFLTGKVLEIDELSRISRYYEGEHYQLNWQPTGQQNQNGNILSEYSETYDTIIFLRDITSSLNNEILQGALCKLLNIEGCLIAFAKANSALYNGTNQGINEWKKQNLNFIKANVGGQYQIEKVRYFTIGQIPEPETNSQEYQERVADFSNEEAVDFDIAGLNILIVIRKRYV